MKAAKMLGWMFGMTRLDRIENECIRGCLGVADIARKITDNRLTRYRRGERWKKRETVLDIRGILIENR